MLEEMHVFATIVEQSSLNRASALLNVTQPALSRKISKLEEELGVELFKRVANVWSSRASAGSPMNSLLSCVRCNCAICKVSMNSSPPDGLC